MKKKEKEQNPECPECDGQSKKYGVRKNKLQKLQQYRCKDCGRKFTLNPIKHKTYTTSTILNAVSNYNIGHTLKKSAKLTNQIFKTKITPKMRSYGLKNFKANCLTIK